MNFNHRRVGLPARLSTAQWHPVHLERQCRKKSGLDCPLRWIGEAGRCSDQMALLGAHRLRAIDQPARPDALATGRLVVEQTKPLRAPAASWAYEHRPVWKRPYPDADLVPDPRRRTGHAPSLRPSQSRQAPRGSPREPAANPRSCASWRRELIPLDTYVYFAVQRLALRRRGGRLVFRQFWQWVPGAFSWAAASEARTCASTIRSCGYRRWRQSRLGFYLDPARRRREA